MICYWRWLFCTKTKSYTTPVRCKWYAIEDDFFALRLNNTTDIGKWPFTRLSYISPVVLWEGTMFHYPPFQIFKLSTTPVYKRQDALDIPIHRYIGRLRLHAYLLSHTEIRLLFFLNSDIFSTACCVFQNHRRMMLKH
jgi:hypothetical protein